MKYYLSREVNQSLQKILFLPILIRLNELNINLRELTSLLNEKGYNYTYGGLNAVKFGHSSANLSFNYFGTIYAVLNISPPTPETLFNNFLEVERLRANKAYRAEANKAKKLKKID
jgi:hypothetical protein